MILKTLLILETGAVRPQAGGSKLSIGDDGFDINALTANGQTLMKRSIESAAGKEDDSSPPGAVRHGRDLRAGRGLQWVLARLLERHYRSAVRPVLLR